MGALDSTIVLLAFPVINDSLHSDFVITIWIILAYLLVLAVATTQMGRIGDIYGRSKIFNMGFVIFTVGSALCGFSTNIYLLITFRVVQAIGGAILQATSGAIIADVFPREVRGKAYGYNSLGYTSGAMIGIVLGGILTTFVNWQFIFFLNIPIGLVAVIIGLKYLKDTTKNPAKMDIGGMVLLALALIILSLGLIDFASLGLNLINSILIVAGALLVPLFIWYDRKQENPMIDFEAFKNKILRNSIFSAFLVSLGYFQLSLVIMYLQGIRGLSPLTHPCYWYQVRCRSFLGPQWVGSDKYGSRELNHRHIHHSCHIDFLSMSVDFHYIVLLPA
jgi:MFS family permease